ncbi:MAG: cyclic nucleotide-binding domain-containing protein [Gammaproteobacteria bacterium]|nr:cyclic nucleotide-binding domain-containing protein [Gammaproteobacteria bacterium]
MSEPTIISPVSGARVVAGDSDVVLFGQPPEVLKALLLNKVPSFTTLVLTDIKEKGGSLTNNLEFPLYFFLFFSNKPANELKLTLVGDPVDISHAIRLLRFTLTGPVAAELDAWGTEPDLKKEWLQVAEELALKDPDGNVIEVEKFFDIRPFEQGEARLPELTIKHTGLDQYQVSNKEGSISIDLSEDQHLEPSYPVQKDNVPGGLVKLGLEVLGGASGFSPDEPCTGLALCHNGEYIVIDSMPFLDQHLRARGISKHQIRAVFLTHLHDDHCTMFPLMLMPHVVEVITTLEIFEMAMEKLSCGLGWSVESVRQHFKLFAVRPGVPVNYYGLLIEPHLTVHSIPTIGATFSTAHRGGVRQICVVGDNHSMDVIKEFTDRGLVRAETYDTLKRLYSDHFNMLVADGGAGAIHGDPEDAIKSKSERVVYVHVDKLTNKFDTTFSLAMSGKRYTIIDGDPVLHSSQIANYLGEWLEEPISNRWLRSLLAEAEIRRYNNDDVILVQDAESHDYVYLVLTGYCEVVQHDGERLNSIARVQAGDVVGEMASISGKGSRNASVVSETPVTVCVFPERIFNAFIKSQGLTQKLSERWAVRPLLKALPCFADLTSTVLLSVSVIADRIVLGKGEALSIGDEGWYLLVKGALAADSGERVSFNASRLDEFGWQPFARSEPANITATEDCELIFFGQQQFAARILAIPQLNYYLRKYRAGQSEQPMEWQLGAVEPR